MTDAEAIEQLFKLKSQLEMAMDIHNSGRMRDNVGAGPRAEHPDALFLIGDFAIYRRFPEPQSLREHANDALKPVTHLDCVGTEGGKATTSTIKP